MALQAIAYVSDALSGLSIDKVDDLSRAAAAQNKTAGVTGILLYDGKRFLQYIEGPEDGTSLVYSRILNAGSHLNVIELARGSVSERRFPYWAMRWIPVDEAQLEVAAFSDWTGLSRATDRFSVATKPPALVQLEVLAAPYIN